MVKGPTTVTEMIAFHAGGYGFVPYGLRSSRVGYKNRKRIAPFYVKNEQRRVGRRPAAALGRPSGPRRSATRWPTTTACCASAWFYHHVSDWAGDDAFIEKMSDSIRKFNYMGDTQFLSGEVVAKRPRGARGAEADERTARSL